jgi:hypothetical protein
LEIGLESAASERIVNDLASASVSLAGSRQGSKAVEKRRRVARRTGAVEDAACSTGANPPRPMRRFITFQGSGLRRTGVSSDSVVSYPAAAISATMCSASALGSPLTCRSASGCEHSAGFSGCARYFMVQSDVLSSLPRRAAL